MNALAEAQNMYTRIAEGMEGQRGADIGSELGKAADAIRARTVDTRGNVSEVLRGPEDPEVQKELNSIGVETRNAVQQTLEEEQIDPSEAEEVASHLERASDDLKETVGTVKSANLPDGVAGQAMLNAQGSATFDPGAIQGQDSVIDPTWARAVAEHEGFHTDQKAPDADEIHVGDQTITATEFIEAGAIGFQAEEVPSSVSRLSDEYRRIHREIGGLHPDIIELSRHGEMRKLERLANERLAA